MTRVADAFVHRLLLADRSAKVLPTSQAVLREWETVIGRELPLLLRSIYLLQNGQTIQDGSHPLPWPQEIRLMPAEECISVYKSYRHSATKYLSDTGRDHDENSVTRQADRLLSTMVPFANDGAGGDVFLDYDPPPGRPIGQVVYVFPAIAPVLVAHSIVDLIERSVHCLDKALITFDAHDASWKTAEGRDLSSLWDLR